jgi:hypothetical protein
MDRHGRLDMASASASIAIATRIAEGRAHLVAVLGRPADLLPADLVHQRLRKRAAHLQQAVWWLYGGH